MVKGKRLHKADFSVNECRVAGVAWQILFEVAFLLDDVPHGVGDAHLESQIQRSVTPLIVIAK